MTAFAVVIVNHNTRDDLRCCLRSVEAENPAEIVVADTDSSDGSPDMVRAEFPRATLAHCENRGYGAAANQGIRQCRAAYILLLNSDTLVAEGTLQALGSYLDCHLGVGIAGPRLLSRDGTLQPSCFPFPGTVRWIADNDDVAPLIRAVPAFRKRSFRTWSHDRARAVPWVKGAAMAIRRSAFERAGGFDEGFFLYYEETDLCRRMAKQGYETHFTPAASVVHTEEGSTTQYGARMTVQLFDSMVRYLRSHCGPVQAACYSSLYRFVCGLRLVRQAARLRFTRDPAQRDRLSERIEGCRRIVFGS